MCVHMCACVSLSGWLNGFFFFFTFPPSTVSTRQNARNVITWIKISGINHWMHQLPADALLQKCAHSILFSSFSSCDFDYSQSRTDLKSELLNSFSFLRLVPWFRGVLLWLGHRRGAVIKGQIKVCVCLVVGFKLLLSGELGLLLQLSLRSLRSPFSSEMLFS